MAGDRLNSKRNNGYKIMSGIQYSFQLKCYRCGIIKPKQDGSYQVYNNGKNQKWVCYECQEKKVNSHD